jgi:hypothetical protein
MEIRIAETSESQRLITRLDWDFHLSIQFQNWIERLKKEKKKKDSTSHHNSNFKNYNPL